MVLGDDFHSEVVFEHLDVGIVSDRLDESSLDFEACVVGMVEDSEFGMSSFPMKVEVAVFVLVEIDTPVDEFPDLFRRIAYHLLHRIAVGDVVACNHGVLNVFLKIIDEEVGDRSDASLRLGSVGLIDGGFTDDGDFTFFCPCHLEGITHSGHT